VSERIVAMCAVWWRREARRGVRGGVRGGEGRRARRGGVVDRRTTIAPTVCEEKNKTNTIRLYNEDACVSSYQSRRTALASPSLGGGFLRPLGGGS
jgi:hypothetical protein